MKKVTVLICFSLIYIFSIHRAYALHDDSQLNGFDKSLQEKMDGINDKITEEYSRIDRPIDFPDSDNKTGNDNTDSDDNSTKDQEEKGNGIESTVTPVPDKFKEDPINNKPKEGVSQNQSSQSAQGSSTTSSSISSNSPITNNSESLEAPVVAINQTEPSPSPTKATLNSSTTNKSGSKVEFPTPAAVNRRINNPIAQISAEPEKDYPLDESEKVIGVNGEHAAILTDDGLPQLVQSDYKTTINLAWGLALIPFTTLVFFLKRIKDRLLLQEEAEDIPKLISR